MKELPPLVDLNTLTTPRLLALLKTVRSCDGCNIDYRECRKRHPGVEEIKAILNTREHVSKKKNDTTNRKTT